MAKDCQTRPAQGRRALLSANPSARTLLEEAPYLDPERPGEVPKGNDRRIASAKLERANIRPIDTHFDREFSLR